MSIAALTVFVSDISVPLSHKDYSIVESRLGTAPTV